MATDPTTGLKTGLTPEQFAATYNMTPEQAVQLGVITQQDAERLGYLPKTPAAPAATTSKAGPAATTSAPNGLASLPTNLGGLTNLGPGLQGVPVRPGGFYDPSADFPQDVAARQASATKAGQAKAQKEAAQKVEDIKKQIIDLTANASYAETHGADVNALAQKIAPLIAQLPSADAQQLMGSGVLKGTPLGTAVGNYAVQGPAAGQPAKPAAASYDPLALQTMWKSVFGPAFDQASKIAGTVGPGYLAGMNQAIAGAHQTPQAAQQLQGQALAQANLLQQFAKTQAQNVPAGMTLDTLINALGQASGAAQLAQGAAEKNIGYQQALPYTNPTAAAAGTSGGLSNSAVNSLLAGSGITPAGAIGANQTTGTPASALYPTNIP
jgi:hypothetical protein